MSERSDPRGPRRPPLANARGWRPLCLIAGLAAGLAGRARADESEAPGSSQAPPQRVLVTTRERVPIAITGNFGTGCRGVLTGNERTVRDGRLQVRFDSYGLKFAAHGATYDSLHCQIELAVSGTRGFRYTVQSVFFVGSEALFTDRARARFMSSVWWSGWGPSLRAAEPVVRQGPVPVGSWRHTQEFALENERESDCFASDADIDQLTISTDLILWNDDPREPAEFTLVAMTGEASVVVELQATRCL